MPRILKPILAACAGLLLALSAAAPATAEHPEPEPRDFMVEDIGEDNCTFFLSIGQARWHATHPPEAPAVTISGMRAIAVPGANPDGTDPCVPQPNAPRQIEFTAYGDGFPLSANIVPFGFGDSGREYEFTFEARAEIDTITVAICEARLPDGSDRCGETATITRDDAPETPYCDYSYDFTRWDGGFIAQVGITPLVSASTGWRIEFDLPEGSSITSQWNGEMTLSGSSVRITNTAWNGTIAAGGTTRTGFGGYSEPPAPSEIRVYVDGELCVDSSPAA